MSAPLAADLVTYRDRLDEMLKDHAGEFVVIKGDRIVAYHPAPGRPQGGPRRIRPRARPDQAGPRQGTGPAGLRGRALMPTFPLVVTPDGTRCPSASPPPSAT